jgi:hypothetical protein
LPRVCTDPAAWGALHDELEAGGWHISLETGTGKTTCELLRWIEGPTKQYGMAVESGPGRALALAFLKAVQP